MRLLGVLGTGLVPWDTPLLHADDAGLTRGDGCFEGLRVHRGAVENLARHLTRMARSAAALDITFDVDGWSALVAQACGQWPSDGPDGAMKLVLTRGRAGAGAATGLLTVVPADPDFGRLRTDGIAAVTLPRGVGPAVFADAPWLLGGIKTLSYAVNMAALREAARRGADDVIFTDSDGGVLEAPTASVLWSSDVAGRQLCTVAPDANGILAGTTQQLLFERAADAGWTVGESAVAADDLARAPGVWLVSAVRGPVEVVTLDGQPRARVADATRELQRLAGFGT